MKKVFSYFLAGLLVLGCGLFFVVQIIMSGPEFGGAPLKERRAILEASSNFKDGSFKNTIKQADYGFLTNIKEMMGDQVRIPPAPFPQVKPQFSEVVEPGLRAVWFGHASVLVEIDGYRVFFDPMLSSHAFPVKAIAPSRMNLPPISIEELPRIDAVFISHDHYDHLDMKSIQHLSKQGASFFVGLGIGAHLEKWNVPKDKINEMDWWQSISFRGLTINCTEARHYSGRKSMNRSTLWTSWLIQGPEHTVFHSGDSGYSPHFKKIQEKFPNIDMSLVKVGDYGEDQAWRDIHMVPEDSVKAHLDVGASVMIPIHWGVFKLSYHSWDEPIERTIKAAKAANVNLATPKLGEVVEFGDTVKIEPWWRNL